MLSRSITATSSDETKLSRLESLFSHHRFIRGRETPYLLGLVGNQKLFKTVIDLLISQVAVVVRQTCQCDCSIRVTEFGSRAWLQSLLFSKFSSVGAISVDLHYP